MHSFSYAAYKHLISTLRESMPLMDFSDVNAQKERFFILRHDVEFSVEKACEMACLEHDELGICSSYFFQIRNDVYNPLSHHAKKLIQEIYRMGHRIGLHVNSGSETDFSNIKASIKRDINLLQTGLGVPVDRFSWHRPCHSLLEMNINIRGLINTYDKRFFHFYGNKPLEHLNVYYYSDSEHVWKYGDPLDMIKKPVKKLQLLIHPYSWSIQGYDNEDNFRELIQQKTRLMIQHMNEECHHFPQNLLNEQGHNR